MPTIHLINSIKILMYFDDHVPPHFHAQYNEHEEIFVIEDLTTYAGKLPTKQRRLVLDWASSHQDFLRQKWEEFNQ